MDIGKKIKELRLSKMMTQTELAGHEITRNMLSRIENGAALPSLGTVIYLAERLGVPAGLLLAEDGDSFVFLKNKYLNNIKKAYIDENFGLCRDICKELLELGHDDEAVLIMTEATYKLAESELLSGRLYSCKSLLDDAIIYAKQTIYNTDTVYYCSKALFYHIRHISPSLDSDNIECRNLAGLTKIISNCSKLCRYLNVMESIEENRDESNELYSPDDNPSLYSQHIAAKLYMKKGMFEEALKILNSIINKEDIIPVFIMYLISADIEICSKQTGDYKSAYEFATSRISLLEGMLSEV